MVVNMKQCIKCKKLLPKTSEYFYYRNKFRGWFNSWCKSCKIEYRKQNWNEELQAQRIKRNNQPYKPRTKTTQDYQKEYYKKHRKEVIAKSKLYRENNSDKVKMCQKKYREKNKITIRETKRI